MKKEYFSLLLLGLVLAGCASMSKRECVTANWQQRGAADGNKGLPVSTLRSHGEACAAVSVVPDAIAYVTGYRQGLQDYCTPENGLQLGTVNREYLDVCPPQLEKAFLPSYIEGLQLKLIQLELDPRTGGSQLTHFGHSELKQKSRSFASETMPLTAEQIPLRQQFTAGSKVR
jgi:hypothetical protein